MKKAKPVHTSEFLDIALQKAILSVKEASSAYAFNVGSYTFSALNAAIATRCAIEQAITSFENFSAIMSIGLEELGEEWDQRDKEAS